MAINIMITDDHSMIREGLKNLLELDGDIKVIAEAENGEDCLDKLKTFRPDVLLLDINMPNYFLGDSLFSKKQNGKSGGWAQKRPPKGGLTGENSASLLKAGAAAAAGDGDFSLAPGNPQLLAAVGAFEVAVFLVPVYRALKAPPTHHRAGHLEKLGIFSPAAGSVAGESTKQEKEKHRQGQPVQDLQPKQSGDQIQDQVQNQQSQVELVGPVAAVHKTLDGVADHRQPPK